MTREAYLDRFRAARESRLWVLGIAVGILFGYLEGPGWVSLGVLFAVFATYLLFRVGLYELSATAFRGIAVGVAVAVVGLTAAVAIGWLPLIVLAAGLFGTIAVSCALAFQRILYGAGY